MKTKAYRHGEIALRPIKALPNGLEKAKTDVIAEGSSGANPHKVLNGELYFKNVDQFVFGYLVIKKGGRLLNNRHGDIVSGKQLKEAIIPEGIYELRHQNEETHEGMRVVVD